MNFEFATAGRIVFGRGSLVQAAQAARDFGRRALVVTGGNQSRAGRLIASLGELGISTITFAIHSEPAIEDVERGVTLARAEGCDLVVGFGGGSAIDAAKAISALITNPGQLSDYLEVVGRAQPLVHAALPCIAIPTTAGTGAEVTRNAVIASVQHRVKVSLRSPLMLPRLAVVDPELTFELPPMLTATTGLDALTQLIEPYVSIRANPMTDALCIEGLRRISRSLRRAVEDGRDASAREDMSLASLFGGLALANAGLGAVHGFAGPIGGIFPAAHGAICAALLPHVTAANLKALRARAPSHDALARYGTVARLLTGRSDAAAEDAVPWLADLVTALGIPRLPAYGVTAADVPPLVAAAAKASSMKGNPIPLTTDECEGILLEGVRE